MLLELTTHVRRALLIGVAFLVWAPVAQAWTWPVQGPVLQPFVYDEAHPYAAGQHRGIDVGADSAGETVLAPAAGTVSFAGSVPTSGSSVTIQTADGYSITLTHLGSISVSRGAMVGEGDAVGTIGPSGTPEFDQPYVHLGIRATADPNGYLDPLRFLPPVTDSGSTGDDSTTARPSTSQGASSTPVPAASPQPTVHRRRTRVSHDASTRTASSSSSQPMRTHISLQQPASRRAQPEGSARDHARRKHRRLHETNSLRRPVVGAAAPTAPTRLDAGHEIRPSPHVALPRPQQAAPAPLLPLVLNGLAAFVAVAAAFAAGRRRRRSPAGAQVLQFPRRTLARRAA